METWQLQLLLWALAGVVALPLVGPWRSGDGYTRAATFIGALLMGPYLLVPALCFAGYRRWRDTR